MAGIHDVVVALGRRDGVDAVIILGNDGLPIDSHVADGADPEVLSDYVASRLDVPMQDKQRLLETLSVRERLDLESRMLAQGLAALRPRVRAVHDSQWRGPTALN